MNVNMCSSCLLLVFATGATAQTPTEPKRPLLAVSEATKTTEPGGNATFSLTIRNSSVKSLKAIVARVEIADQNGNVLQRSCGMNVPGGNGMWASGETLHVQVRSNLVEKNTSPFSYTPSIDYVLFDDGSAEGPDSCQQSSRIRDIRNATDAERRRLKKLRDDKGIQAVSDDLDRP